MKKNFINSISALMILIGSSTVPAQPQPPGAAIPAKLTVAVNNLEGRGVSPDEAATLSDVLRTRLADTRKFMVMERGQMEEILKEQGFQQSGACSDEACLVQMGQLLGSQRLVAGSIGKVGKAYSINVRLISVESGEILVSVSHNYTGPIENLLTGEMEVVAKKLAGIGPTIKDRSTKRNKGPIILIGSVVVVAAAGGIAAYVLMSQDHPADQAEVSISW